MAVLIEAVSVVIPRKVLDVSYPGGTAAYLHAAIAPTCPSRWVAHDDRLTSVSFLSPDEVRAFLATLGEFGIVHVDDDRCIELCVVDQRFGPTMPCDWLEWDRHPDGFTMAWLAGTERGDLAVPEWWTPEHSRALVRTDVRDEPERMFRLSEEDGIEYWIDFLTGRLSAGLPQRDT